MGSYQNSPNIYNVNSFLSEFCTQGSPKFRKILGKVLLKSTKNRQKWPILTNFWSKGSWKRPRSYERGLWSGSMMSFYSRITTISWRTDFRSRVLWSKRSIWSRRNRIRKTMKISGTGKITQPISCIEASALSNPTTSSAKYPPSPLEHPHLNLPNSQPPTHNSHQPPPPSKIYKSSPKPLTPPLLINSLPSRQSRPCPPPL